MITRKNYEIYVIDYLEGKLNDKLKKEFERFLLQNPDIKAEILSIDKVSIPNKQNEFPEKWKLKKSSVEGLTYLEELLIAQSEGISTKRQKEEFAQIIKENPNILAEYSAYKNTHLIPPTVFYPHKEQLKKQKTTTSEVITQILSYAAILLIAFILFTFWKHPQTDIAAKFNIPEKNFLLPAQLNPLPKITRPIIVKNDSEQRSKQPVSVSTMPQKIMPISDIQDTSITAPQEIIITHLESKKFSIKPTISSEINLPKSKLPIQYQGIITAKNFAEVIFDKASDWAKEKGIIISRNSFIIKIKDKNYGIAFTGR